MKSSLHFLPPFSSPTSSLPLPLSTPCPIEPRAFRDAQNLTRRVALAYEQCHGSASRRAAAQNDWRARMWRPRLHMDGGHNRALACTWKRHGSLESGCSNACTPRRSAQDGHNRISTLSVFFLSTHRWSKRRGCGQGRSDLVKDGFVEGAQVAASSLQ